ncbi:hypothetical protein EVA_13593 [gut metagenome]|uniref:Uncharacterized protein n=1 Tax=gut metagenome TaxID=749906 RepID=J9CE82_9ZZZZ
MFCVVTFYLRLLLSACTKKVQLLFFKKLDSLYWWSC